VLDCAHDNKETKTSHLSSQESFDVVIDFGPFQKYCVKGNEIAEQIQSLEKES